MAPHARPISPHLEIYRFTLTMAMSIVHRITGVANYVGTLLLVAWLGAAALGGDAFALVNGIFGSWIGQVVLFGYTWSLFHHMLGGVKHFIWDAGHGLEVETAEKLGWVCMIGSVVLTILTIIIV